jgi:hypothetical protein
MLRRNQDGKLRLNSLDFEIFIGDLFQQCENESEIGWLKDNLIPVIEGTADERIEELEDAE